MRACVLIGTACVFAISGAAPGDVTYDFASADPGGTARAYAGEGASSFLTDDRTPSSAAASGEYAALAAADGSSYATSAETNNTWALQRFRFRVTESPAAISALSITWIGGGANGNPGRIDGASVHIWRASTGSYELLATGADNELVQTLTRTITANAADYRDADGDITILVRSRDKAAGVPFHNTIHTDYISLVINAGQAGAGPLLAHYTFDEGLGSMVGDCSGNNMHGTAYGGVWTTAGAVAGALGFAGVDRVVVPDDDILDVSADITVMAFIGLDTAAGDQDAFRKGDNYALFEIRAGGPPAVVLADGSGSPQTYSYSRDGSSFLGGWHHVAFTYDGAYVRLYIDGKLDAAFPRTGVLATNDDWLGLGTDGGSDSARFHGLLDDARLYNVALDPAQIAAIAALHPPSPRIVGWEEVSP